MAPEVFISYASEDKAIAEVACASLEAQGLGCWMAPRNILAGISYAEAIIDAISEAKVFVLIFSNNSNKSPQIEREVERAVSKGIPLITFRIEDASPSKSLEFFISAPHWLEALEPPLQMHLEKLVRTIKKLLARKTAKSEEHVAEISVASAPVTEDKITPQITRERTEKDVTPKTIPSWIIIFGFITAGIGLNLSITFLLDSIAYSFKVKELFLYIVFLFIFSLLFIMNILLLIAAFFSYYAHKTAFKLVKLSCIMSISILIIIPFLYPSIFHNSNIVIYPLFILLYISCYIFYKKYFSSAQIII